MFKERAPYIDPNELENIGSNVSFQQKIGMVYHFRQSHLLL